MTEFNSRYRYRIILPLSYKRVKYNYHQFLSVLLTVTEDNRYEKGKKTVSSRRIPGPLRSTKIFSAKVYAGENPYKNGDFLAGF